MPELPEVEVTRRKLSPIFVGRTIEGVETTAPSYFFLTAPKVLRRRLTGQVVQDLLRHGKYLVAELGDGSRLLLHLGMTGQLFSSGVPSVQLLRHTAGGTLTAADQSQGFAPDAHTHLCLRMSGEQGDVFFRDVRKFGKVQWLAPQASCERLDKLGPDALQADGEHLFEASRKRRIPIKTLLLDQKILAGVGNIYADEALFRVRVAPLRPAQSLTRKTCDQLVAEVQAVMLRSIETGGSSIRDYINPDGATGAFQDERQVYGMTGAPCPKCKRPIEREVIGGRASHFCRRCQR